MFTSALFLSGYVLQQQTVRDLRAAIQPKPTPEAARLYLPTQFAVQPEPSPKADVVQDLEDVSRERTEILSGGGGTVEVKVSSNEIYKDTSEQIDANILEGSVEGAPRRDQTQIQNNPKFDMSNQKPLFSEQKQAPRHLDLPEEASADLTEGQTKKEKPLSRAERRKKIKEEILAAGEGEGFKGYKRRQW